MNTPSKQSKIVQNSSQKLEGGRVESIPLASACKEDGVLMFLAIMGVSISRGVWDSCQTAPYMVGRGSA